MEISNVANVASSGQEAAARQGLSSDLDTFLKLLTAQIENQDPLEPADGTEYAAQLAQFSNVEQAIRTNELLSDMVAKLSQQDLTTAANWIGMEVRNSGPIAMTGQTVTLLTDIPTAADRAELVATDPDGQEVMRRPLSAGTKDLAWSGGDGTGGHLPDGVYTLSVVSYAGAQELTSRPVQHFGKVNEVLVEPTGAEIILEDGQRLPIDSVSGVRPSSG